MGTGFTLYGDYFQGLLLVVIGVVILVPLFKEPTSA
jgi:hypothetical protein